MHFQIDPSILSRAIAGDSSALAHLLQQHYPRVLQYVRKHMPPEIQNFVEPDDIVQDTFFECCRLIRGFKEQGEESFFRWLATIARHRLIDQLRTHRARRAATPDQDQVMVNLLNELALYYRTPSKSAASHEFMLALETAISSLSDSYRNVVTMRHLEGFSVAETAEKLGCSAETVYLHSCRALKELRSSLKFSAFFG